MSIHRIRLRAPWRRELLAHGAIRWTRSFQRPTHLGPTEQVWLVVTGVSAEGTAGLNDQALGQLVIAKEARFDITPLLAPSNRLVLEFAGANLPVDSAEPPAEVALEIEDWRLRIED